MSDFRTEEIERRLRDVSDAMRRLQAETARLAQLADKLSVGNPQQFSGSSGGAGWAEGPAIAARSSETMTVQEVRISGEIERTDQTVINPFNSDTRADRRLMLVKTSDGGWLIVNQDCLATPED